MYISLSLYLRESYQNKYLPCVSFSLQGEDHRTSSVWQMLVTSLNALLDAAQIFWLCAEQGSVIVFKHVSLPINKHFTKINNLNKKQVIIGKLVTITVEGGGTRRIWEKDLPSNWDSISCTVQGAVKRAPSITNVDK